MNKYELITEIVMLCDELESHKRELEDLQRSIGGDGRINTIDLICLGTGRKKIFDDYTYFWEIVKATTNEDTDTIEVTTFEEFRDKAFIQAPDFMSKNAFFEYFDSEFRTMYDEAKEKAIASLKEQEGE